MGNIAVFHYKWPLQIHTINLARKLILLGHKVDIFLYDSNYGFIESTYRELLDGDLTINHLKTVPTEKVRFLINRFSQKFLGIKIFKDPVLERMVLKAVASNVSYNHLIGVEKLGLIWAGELQALIFQEAKLVYYSLELYFEDSIYSSFFNRFHEVKRWEREYHNKCWLTIIQDSSRKDFLFQQTGSASAVAYLPVSVTGKVNSTREYRFHELYKIPLDRKVILYFGQLDEQRGISELAKISQQISDDYVIIVHGHGSDSYIDDLRKSESPNFIVSTFRIPETQIASYISSCDIGIAYYSNNSNNDRLTIFSSEKIALYAKCLKPFIVFSHMNATTLRDEFKCCEIVDSFEDVPRAVSAIFRNYADYQEELEGAYVKYYNFENVSDSLNPYFKW